MEIRTVLADGVRRGASDLHLSAGLPAMIRLDGDIEPLDSAALSSSEIGDCVDEIASEREREMLRGGLDVDFGFDLPGVSRFRVNVFVQHRGMGAVFRTVPERVPTIEELGLGPTFPRIADTPRGLVLVAGPTGSGKSTTLAALVDYINTHHRKHILTIEDPIEFVHEARNCLVNQREIGRHAREPAHALRAALREDPDVILVGELRDLETIRLALTAAETGHLVLATLHTPSAPKSVDRIVDVFPPGEKETIRSILAESLQAVVWQTLLKSQTGGRVAAHEIMIATTAVRSLVREHKVAQLYSAMQTSSGAGMQTLDQCLAGLVARGEVKANVAREVARYPDSLR